jgi:hypothetical protein
MHFFHFYLCSSNLFACKFCLVYFSQLFQWIPNQREILRFLISFLIFFKNKFFWVISAVFANFKAKCAKNGSKNHKTYFVNVS